MATKDEILAATRAGLQDDATASPASSSLDIKQQAPIGIKPPAVGGIKMPKSTEAVSTVATQPKDQTGTSDGEGFFTRFYTARNPYKEPSPEELEKERRRRKREAIFSAIGDGISAMANLYFTSKGAPSSYDPRASLSGQARRRWDMIDAERAKRKSEWTEGYMRAKKADEESERDLRNWRRMLSRDAESDRRYKAEQAFKEKQQQAEEKYREDKLKAEAKAAEEAKRRFNVQQAGLNERAKLAAETREKAAKASAARAVRGRQLGFAYDDGNQVSIYENVWKGSMQLVYDELFKDMRKAHEADPDNNPYVPRHRTEREKEDFVKQNWTKSPRARQRMLFLSTIDPATMTSDVSEEEIIDYNPEEEEEIIDYVPGK